MPGVRTDNIIRIAVEQIGMYGAASSIARPLCLSGSNEAQS